MTTRTRDDAQWLMDLLGPEDLAKLSLPLTDAQAAILDDFLAEHHPVEHAIRSASAAELPAVVDRLIAEATR